MLTDKQFAQLKRHFSLYSDLAPLWKSYEALCAKHDKVVLELARVKEELREERSLYADSPDDRLYHAADKSWWKREDSQLVRAEPPILLEAREALLKERIIYRKLVAVAETIKDKIGWHEPLCPEATACLGCALRHVLKEAT